MRATGFTDVRSRQILFTSKRVPTPLLPAFKPSIACWSRCPASVS